MLSLVTVLKNLYIITFDQEIYLAKMGGGVNYSTESLTC